MAAFGIFSNQGEVCSANSRLLVERPIHEELVAKLVERAEATVVGDPLDLATWMGPLVDEGHAERVMGFTAGGCADAELGPAASGSPSNGSGATFVAPTIFDRVPSDARLAREEVFGPVLSVLDFEGEDDGVADREREPLRPRGIGLDLEPRSRPPPRPPAPGRHRLRQHRRCPQPADPFGGFKGSGFGRDLSLHALDKYTGLKTTWIKHRP
ncbi:MAG: aldehyde dehydrogenase family protein [Solirubrobacterales bacterium]